jgi:diguanylate cyclase (GGDEF)-like protein
MAGDESPSPETAGASWHPMLQRQLRRAQLTPDTLAAAHPALPGLMDRVSRAYADAEQDRYLMERSQEVASREMGELYNELKSSQARLASLVSLSSDWVWEQDATLRFHYVSSHDLGSTGDLAALLTGEQIGEAVTPIDDDDARTHRLLTDDRKPFRNLRFRVERPGSTPVYIRISGEPVFDGERFTGYRGVGSDVTNSTVAEQQVRQLARYDSLTGLPNRSMLIEQLESGLRQARVTRLGLAVLFIDLDRFKYVNDTLGHDAGDELLKIMAKRLSGLLRPVDTVARLGGDEFVILIQNTIDPSTLSKVAARVLNVLCEPMRLSDRPVQVSASVGIALFPSDGDDTTTLLKNADSAMYLAKARGKNNFQFFTSELAERATRHFALEGDLRQAVGRNELVLHYQPRFRLSDGAMCGMEALLRWQHPTRGLIPPGEFIDLAEESGLIVQLGHWVMGEACRQIRLWREAGLEPPCCAINLSARQFGNEGLIEEVQAALSEAVLEAGALEVEITESLLMSDPDRAQQVLLRLHTLGVGIAIDDFGTGYSSLAYLKRFPAQTLKIDRSFIQGLPQDRDDAAITQAVIAMAHSLEMRVVAEGVETPEQLAFLKGHGCDEVQGYLLGRPMTAEKLAPLLPREALALGTDLPAV